MNDEDINKLAAKLTVSLATKEDLKQLKDDLQSDIKRLEDKIDTVLQFAEAVDETTTDLSNKVKRIESIPVIAHELKNHRS